MQEEMLLEVTEQQQKKIYIVAGKRRAEELINIARKLESLASAQNARIELLTLEAATDGLDGAPKRLLVVDQFEELFTHGSGEAGKTTQQTFVQRLWTLASSPPLCIIATLRSGFTGKLGSIAIDSGVNMDRLFTDAHRDHHLFLPQMSADGLRAAIEGPARAVGLRVEAELRDLRVCES